MSFVKALWRNKLKTDEVRRRARKMTQAGQDSPVSVIFRSPTPQIAVFSLFLPKKQP
jgi:hypothetical protein